MSEVLNTDRRAHSCPRSDAKGAPALRKAEHTESRSTPSVRPQRGTRCDREAIQERNSAVDDVALAWCVNTESGT